MIIFGSARQIPRAFPLACLIAVAPLRAAPPDTESGESALEATAALEEVVVTARKREENLQDTPISLSVLTATDLEHQTIGSLQDIASYAPNLRGSAGPQGGSSGHYFIRGIGQLDFIASTDPGVGTYLDGVYLGRTTGTAFALLNVERIEVLRGPQGTLFGRNTIGGALNVIAAAPPGELQHSVAITVGDRNRYEGRLMLGGPLIEDRLLADLAVLAKSQDGWQRRLIDGGRFGDEETYGARAAARWKPSEQLTVLAALDATRSRGSADPHFLVAADPAHGGRPEFVVTDPSVTWAGQRSPDDLDVRGSSITATYTLADLTLKSITAYRALDSDTGIDFDVSPFGDLDQLVFTRQSQWSQELQLGGHALDARLTWLLGTYYFGEHVEQAIPLVFFGTRISQNNDLDNDSYALFSHVTYTLTPRLSVSGGARFTHETKRHAFDHFVDLGDARDPLFPPTTLRDEWDSFTPRLGFEFRATPDLLLYSSVSQGFRSGGFNGRPFGTEEFLSYEPETLTAYEAGLKSEWLDRRLRVNAAAFYSRYEDIQLTLTTTAPSGVPIVVTGNAGGAELHGFEIDLTASPAEQLLLIANVGGLTNEYTDLAPGAAVTTADRLPVSPRWTANAAVEYRSRVGRAGHLRRRVDYSYTSRYNYLFDNPPLSWQEAYGVWNVRVAFEPSATSWEISAYLLNATDRDHSGFREDVRESFGTAIVWPARPREWGLEVRYRL